jgi:hypothetical protein
MRDYYLAEIGKLHKEVEDLKTKNHDQARHINKLKAEVERHKAQNATIRAEFELPQIVEGVAEIIKAFPQFPFIHRKKQEVLKILWDAAKADSDWWVSPRQIHTLLYSNLPEEQKPGLRVVHTYISYLRGDLKFSSLEIIGKYNKGWRLVFRNSIFTQESSIPDTKIISNS